MIKADMGTVQITGDVRVLMAEFETLLGAFKTTLHLTDEKIVEMLVKSDRNRYKECTKEVAEEWRKAIEQHTEEMLRYLDKEQS